MQQSSEQVMNQIAVRWYRDGGCDPGEGHSNLSSISSVSFRIKIKAHAERRRTHCCRPLRVCICRARANFLCRWRQACPLKASLTLKMPPRAASINVAQLKTLAEIVAQPELDRYELHDQINSRDSTVDNRLEFLRRYDLIQKPTLKDHYHDRHEFAATDTGIFIIRTWQRDRSVTELIDAFQLAVDMIQGTQESSINVAQLYVLKQIVIGRASTVAELMPLCNRNRKSTKPRLKNLVDRRLLETDVQSNRGGNGTVYSVASLGRELIETLDY